MVQNKIFDEKDKTAGLATLIYGANALKVLFKEKVALSPLVQKAKDADILVYTKESYVASPALYTSSVKGGDADWVLKNKILVCFWFCQ